MRYVYDERYAFLIILFPRQILSEIIMPNNGIYFHSILHITFTYYYEIRELINVYKVLLVNIKRAIIILNSGKHKNKFLE